MKTHAGQRAQEALQALATEASLEERLNLASACLDLIDSEHFVEDSNEVAEALGEVKEAFDNDEPRPEKAKAIVRTIAAIFEEHGANEKANRLLSED